MKLHDLRPAEGSRKPRTRVGRGIAAGKGKTAGRGTKGQKSRAGGSIPPWFEGGQTPLHMRIPKLRGFKRRGRIEYEIVNVGDIGRLAETGAFPADETSKKPAPPTVNQDTLREVGLVRTLAKPLKVLGQGELSTALFVVADAFSKSAVTKIEAAGGSVTILEPPKGPLQALGLDLPTEDRPAEARAAEAPAEARPPAPEATAPEAAAPAADAPAGETPEPATAAVDSEPTDAPAPRKRSSRTARSRADAATDGADEVAAAAESPATAEAPGSETADSADTDTASAEADAAERGEG